MFGSEIRDLDTIKAYVKDSMTNILTYATPREVEWRISLRVSHAVVGFQDLVVKVH